jgi:hypothetical protein
MTVDATLVNAANRGMTTVQAASALSSFQTIAAAILDKDNPGLTTALYDWCHALMICHLWAGGDEKSGYKSFSTGDFSASQNPGETIWSLQYRQIIADFQEYDVATATDVRRSDSVIEDFKLDQSTDPVIFTDVDAEG